MGAHALPQTPSLFDARLTDPETSHEAGAKSRKSRKELVAAIRWWVARQSEPVSQFDIADALCGPAWSHATVRSACSAAGLFCVDTLGKSPRGSRCTRYLIAPRLA